MRAGAARHVHEIVVKRVQIAISLLLNVSLMVRRADEVVRMLHGEGALLVRMVHRRKVEALGGGTEIVLMMLVSAHRAVSVVQPVLLLLLSLRVTHGRREQLWNRVEIQS